MVLESNTLSHREFTSTVPAKVIIEANFFVNINYADTLGSGVRNLYKYTKIYTNGSEPELIEDDVFRIVVPLKEFTPQDAPQDVKREKILLEFCETPRTRDEMQQLLELLDREYFRKTILKPLLDSGKLKMTIPDKPNSKHQRYVVG